MRKVMLGVVAALLLSAAGCGGPVNDAEFSGFAGHPLDEAVKRLGPPDRDFDGWACWEWKVRGPAGRTWHRAQLRYDSKTRLVIESLMTGED